MAMTNPITLSQLDEWQRLCEAATPVDWFTVMRYEHGGGRVIVEGDKEGQERDLIADFYGEADRECFLAARSALPALIEAVRELQKQVEQLERAVAAKSDRSSYEDCWRRHGE